MRSAIRWMPEDATYRAQLADDVYATDPNQARLLLQQTTRLNPYDAASHIQLAFLDEADNDLAAAETGLLRAARVDNTFLPSWSLANFYFRRQNIPQFWVWARHAAQMAPNDAAPLFRLAWYITPHAAAIEDRLELQRPEIESQLINFLIARNEPAGVSAAATHLLQKGDDATTPTLLGASDWLIATNHPDLALPLWNGLAAHHKIDYAPLNTDRADTVTNGTFASQPLSRGFDWHLVPVAGISSYLNANPSVLGFEFSGEEPDAFLLLRQTAPIRPGRVYGLVVNFQSDGIASDSGLEWTVSDGQRGTILARTASLSSSQGGQATACFTAPYGAQSVDLTLSYQRHPGTVRPEGKLALSQVRLTTPSPQVCGQKSSHSGAASPGF